MILTALKRTTDFHVAVFFKQCVREFHVLIQSPVQWRSVLDWRDGHPKVRPAWQWSRLLVHLSTWCRPSERYKPQRPAPHPDPSNQSPCATKVGISEMQPQIGHAATEILEPRWWTAHQLFRPALVRLISLSQYGRHSPR